jgi:hypothetical protein
LEEEIDGQQRVLLGKVREGMVEEGRRREKRWRERLVVLGQEGKEMECWVWEREREGYDRW